MPSIFYSSWNKKSVTGQHYWDSRSGNRAMEHAVIALLQLQRPAGTMKVNGAMKIVL
jgi:hypothetical protein